MKVSLITPAGKRSLNGNRATAVRWERILRRLGHRVVVDVSWDGEPVDMMVALHAWRSADSIAAFHEQYPDRLLIVALTGTDIYRFIHSDAQVTRKSIEVAHQLVALHDLAYLTIPERHRSKLTVIKQSAVPLPRRLPPRKRTFDICVAGHLRDEKDSLRAALAARDLPASSKIRVLHYGKAHNEEWGERARQEMQQNPRYHWYGELPHWQVRQAYARCRAMVLSSRMEGGANVVSEAVMADLPVLASDIPGSVGLLGERYSGYYPVGDTTALAELMLKAENDPEFLPLLLKQSSPLKREFTESAEYDGWLKLLDKLI
jgi:putative glycosyltransferase (TIGR04348 family)